MAPLARLLMTGSVGDVRVAACALGDLHLRYSTRFGTGAPVEDGVVGALSGAGETVEAGLSALINGLADADCRTLLALDDYHLIADD